MTLHALMKSPLPAFGLAAIFSLSGPALPGRAAEGINILFAIADDQSWPHASAYGTPHVRTPAFDRLADQGVLFTNAFAPAPQCSPCRAALLTGYNIWQLEEAGTHGSLFPKKFPVFTRILEDKGYHVGFTGKPWSPGNWEAAGWDRNPVGTEYNDRHLTPPTSGISDIDYAENFRDFLSARPDKAPFFFWYGGKEPHRSYAPGSGEAGGIDPSALAVPGFLPDTAVVRQDLADYFLEIEWFDAQLGKMLRILEEAGELDRTVIIVTADNGMPFPSAKANLFELGTHVPLVVSGGGLIKPAISETLVSLIDVAPTVLDLAGLEMPHPSPARSLLPHLRDGTPHRTEVLTGRERHTHARPDNLGYPARALRTAEYLYIWNVKPDRWPAGDPLEAVLDGTADSPGTAAFKALVEGYEDIDASPSKSLILEQPAAWPEAFETGFAKRSEEQLYAIVTDPFCLNNLASQPDHAEVLSGMRETLRSRLLEQGDPRLTGTGDIFESYPRFGSMRPFTGFKERGAYNPAYSTPSTK